MQIVLLADLPEMPSLIKKDNCQFLAKECAQVLVNRFEDQACPEKSVVM